MDALILVTKPKRIFQGKPKISYVMNSNYITQQIQQGSLLRMKSICTEMYTNITKSNTVAKSVLTYLKIQERENHVFFNNMKFDSTVYSTSLWNTWASA